MITVLFVTANPFSNEWDAESDRELYWIRSAIREAKFRSNIRFIEAVAVERSELDFLLAEHQPDVLHLSVPGLSEHGLFFQELDQQRPSPTVNDAISHRLQPSVSAGPQGDDLADVFRSHGSTSNLRLAVINTPFSRRAAAAIVQHVGTVIGMPDIVHQDICVEFSKGFYTQLGSGATVQQAFNTARLHVRRVASGVPFGAVEPYMVRDEYRPQADIAFSRETMDARLTPAPVRTMFWATVGTLRRFGQTLNLGREVRNIQRKLLRSPSRKFWSFIVEWAVRSNEASEHLLVADPAVLIVSGHAGHDGVLLNGPDGQPVQVTGNELCRLLRAGGSNVRCVILNGCNTAAIAKDVAEVTGFAVGMSGLVPDLSAIQFAEHFVMGLAHNRSLVDSFELGIQSIAISELGPFSLTRDVTLCAQGETAGGVARPVMAIGEGFEAVVSQPFLEAYDLDM
jgi:hypothetical protein